MYLSIIFHLLYRNMYNFNLYIIFDAVVLFYITLQSPEVASLTNYIYHRIYFLITNRGTTRIRKLLF